MIRGFARTPAVQNGAKVMVYARFYKEEVEQWESMPYVEVLARANYTGKETVNEVYSIIFNDPEKLAKYDSVYDRSPVEIDDGDGGVIVHTPAERFGMLS